MNEKERMFKALGIIASGCDINHARTCAKWGLGYKHCLIPGPDFDTNGNVILVEDDEVK